MTLTHDAFLGGRLHLWQPARGYRAATDPVFLAAACPARPGDKVLELGCGVGAALLCLNARVPGLALTGLEVQPAYAALALRNAAEAGAQMRVIEGDLTSMPAALRAETFDQVIANPPYYEGSGTPSPDAGRDRAMREVTPLPLWVEVGLKRLNNGGVLTLIQETARLPELMVAGSVTVLPLQAREGRAPGRVIVQIVKGGRAPFRLLAPFVVHEGEHQSAASEAVLRQGAALVL